jgi:hypothetical protein
MCTVQADRRRYRHADWQKLYRRTYIVQCTCEPRNRFQGMNSARLCSLADRYDYTIPTRFLAPIDFLKIAAQVYEHAGKLGGWTVRPGGCAFCTYYLGTGRPAGRRLFTVLVCRQAMGRTGRQAKGLYGRRAVGCTYTRQEGGCAFLNLHVDGELFSPKSGR